MPHNGSPGDERNTIAALEALLADGWQIEPPVLARLAWAPRSAGALDYHFILARGARRSLVVIPESDELCAFCAAGDLLVALPAPQRAPRRRDLVSAPAL